MATGTFFKKINHHFIMNKKIPSLIQAEQTLSEILTLKQFLQVQEKTPVILGQIRDIEKLECKINEIFEVPQLTADFNTFFNQLGWHAHDALNTDIIKQAIMLAQQGGLSRAESILEEYYVENLNFFCTLLCGLPSYYEREHIIERAKERFFAQDYISCVPLILMMADGFSSDILNKGVFTEGARLDAFDCLASQDDAFKEFISFLTKTRRKLSTEPLSMPFRNGIMHGLDVKYDNRLTAIKAWALLFTLREILIRKKNEQLKISEFEEKQQKKMEDLYAYIKDPTGYILRNVKIADAFYNWSPHRTKEEWASIPKSGNLSNFIPCTPEYCLIAFLCEWQAHRYGLMAQLIQLPETTSVGKVAGDLRNALSNKHLENFMIDFVEEERGGIIFGAKLLIGENEEEVWEAKICFVVNNYLNNQINFLKDKRGDWKLNDVIISILCYLRRPEELKTISID